MQRLLTMALLAGFSACAGSAQTSGTARMSTQPGPEPSEQSAPAAAASEAAPPSEPAEEKDLAKAESSVLPARVDAGPIQRSALVSVLTSGVGRFLQKVRAEPHLEAGRFVGWRLVSLFEGSATSRVLRPGDTVLTVNGQGIERPEQFKDVWDKVASRDELVLLVQRDGRRSELHYQIVP